MSEPNQRSAPNAAPLVLDAQTPLPDMLAVVAGERAVVLDAACEDRIAAGSAALAREMAAGRQIYGITTGFGPLIGETVDANQADQHQRHLLYHLATGTGPPFARREVRAIMLVRLVTLTQGFSSVSWPVAAGLRDALNGHVTPCVPERGTVGASGDLTPLAHMALALTGEGTCLGAHGLVPASVELEAAGLAPLPLSRRDALALVNGTAAMTGLALTNGADASGALERSLQLALLHGEVLHAEREAWHPALSRCRGHEGQSWIADQLWQRSEDSQTLNPAGPRYHGEAPLQQDPYSIRCMPQLLGAVRDQWAHHQCILEREVRGISDNPVCDPKAASLWHGGNFFGQSIGFVSDSLSQAVIMLAVASERRIARLTDPTRNGGLPAFLRQGAPGYNSGVMGAQVTASALVAEMRSLAMPAAIQSVPTNNNNQDVVPMGTIAARRCRDVLALGRDVLAIEALCLAQAARLREEERFSRASRHFLAEIRRFTPPLETDRPLSGEIAALSGWFAEDWRRADPFPAAAESG